MCTCAAGRAAVVQVTGSVDLWRMCHHQSCMVEEDVLPPRWCFLPYSPRCSSRVSVTEVCPAACLHVRRILSLSINWPQSPTTHTHIYAHTSPINHCHHVCRLLHNGTRISGLREIYSPCCAAATFFSFLSLFSQCLAFFSSLILTHTHTHFLLTQPYA